MKGRKLNRYEKSRVKEWLEIVETEKISSCPFNTCDLCYSWFPKCEKSICPCPCYTLKYVIKRAKEMMKNK